MTTRTAQNFCWPGSQSFNNQNIATTNNPREFFELHESRVNIHRYKSLNSGIAIAIALNYK
jgi:hypothetical protein